MRLRVLLALIACLWSAPSWATAVHAADNDLQAKINAEPCGGTLTLDDDGSWDGPYYLPNKSCAGPSYLKFTRSGTLPAVCQILLKSCRDAWIANFAHAPKIIRAGVAYGAIFTNFSAGWYEFEGIEIRDDNTGGGAGTASLFIMGECGNTCGAYTLAHTTAELPHHIKFDRVYLHGKVGATVFNGIISTGTNIDVSNSYIDEIHVSGNESHGFYHQTEGPVTFQNNYVNAAGIDVFFGDNTATVNNSLPHDVTVQDNYLTKSCAGYVNAAAVGCAAAYDTYNWQVKDVFEIKRGTDFTVTHNIMENSWDTGQTGEIVIIQMVAPQAGACSGCFGGVSLGCTWCTIARISFTKNVLRHGAEGMIVWGRLTGIPYEATAPVGNTITIRDNLAYDLTPEWSATLLQKNYCVRVMNWPDAIIDHNTCDNDATGTASASTDGIYFDTLTGEYNDRVAITNTFVRQNTFGLFCNGVGVALDCLNSAAPGPTWTWSHMVLQEILGGGTYTYPATTSQITSAAYNAIFTDRAIGHTDDNVDYRVVAGSAYKTGGVSQATDGLDIGVRDFSLLPDPASLVLSNSAHIRIRVHP